MKTQADRLFYQIVTIHRAAGLRFVIFVNDHEPAHVHVIGDGELKVNLLGSNGPELAWAVGMGRTEIRRAMKIVSELQQQFLVRWEEIHG